MEEKEAVQYRIRQIMEQQKLNAGAFAESIGVAQATISQILRGRNMPSTDVLLRLHQRYPNVSLDWLLTGKGDLEENHEMSETNSDFDYPLFAENPLNPSKESNDSENRKDFALEKSNIGIKEIVKQEVIYKERPPRKITEIRIFFDDNTYETFRPEK